MTTRLEYHPRPYAHLVMSQATWDDLRHLAATDPKAADGQWGAWAGMPVYIDECPPGWECIATADAEPKVRSARFEEMALIHAAHVHNVDRSRPHVDDDLRTTNAYLTEKVRLELGFIGEVLAEQMNEGVERLRRWLESCRRAD